MFTPKRTNKIMQETIRYLELYDKKTSKLIKKGKIIRISRRLSHKVPIKSFVIDVDGKIEEHCFGGYNQYGHDKTYKVVTKIELDTGDKLHINDTYRLR